MSRHATFLRSFFGIICLAGLFLGLVSCAGTPREDDPAAVVDKARALVSEGRYSEARSLLLPNRGRSPEVDGVLGEASYALSEWEEAERAWFGARESSNAAVRCGALRGLGELALYRRDPFLAVKRFESAREDVSSEEERRDLTFRIATTSLMGRDFVRARAERARLPDSYPGLSDFDRNLKRYSEDPGLAVRALNQASPPPLKPLPQPKSTRASSVARAFEMRSRAEWSAAPPKRTATLDAMGSVRRITVHHTATPRDGARSIADAAKELRSIQNSHQGERGWADIGYHYLIDGAGRIWEGRQAQYQGAHAGNREANRGNLGIALLGDFDQRPPSREQEAALVRLLQSLMGTHGVSANRVLGHNDVSTEFRSGGTSCPGHHLSSRLAALATQAASSAPSRD